MSGAAKSAEKEAPLIPALFLEWRPAIDVSRLFRFMARTVEAVMDRSPTEFGIFGVTGGLPDINGAEDAAEDAIPFVCMPGGTGLLAFVMPLCVDVVTGAMVIGRIARSPRGTG